jgi:hypothetical protein
VVQEQYTRCLVTASTPEPKGGARCVSSARWDKGHEKPVIREPGVGSEEAPNEELASVRHTNRTDSFPVSGNHERAFAERAAEWPANVVEADLNQPELSGIGGWLMLLAVGQVLGLLQSIIVFSQNLQSQHDGLWTQFPATLQGETALMAAFVCLVTYTTFLLFAHSRHLPKIFIAQLICAILLPIADAIWIAISLNRPISVLFTIDASLGGQIVGTSLGSAIGAAIWIPYIMCSKRVANTFTR